MLENKDYCDYDTCVALSELDPHMALNFELSGTISLYEAQKWLREDNGIEIVVLSKGMVGSPYYSQAYTEDYVACGDEEYSSYEEALSEGINEAVKILKEEQDG